MARTWWSVIPAIGGWEPLSERAWRRQGIWTPGAAVYIDADGEYSPSQIPDLLNPIDAGEAGLCSGFALPGRAPRSTLPPPHCQLRLHRAVMHRGRAPDQRRADGIPGLFSPRPGVRRDHSRLQLRPSVDLGPSQERNAYARSSDLVQLPTKGESFISVKYLWRVPAAMVRQLLNA